mmetsp:Transcript_26712/g.56869  ORF Transcript_26712/g.56869 Transcript_26712/m.56869 type:complete len:272 (-) Transcript_26712:891-1706(-)
MMAMVRMIQMMMRMRMMKMRSRIFVGVDGNAARHSQQSQSSSAIGTAGGFTAVDTIVTGQRGQTVITTVIVIVIIVVVVIIGAINVLWEFRILSCNSGGMCARRRASRLGNIRSLFGARPMMIVITISITISAESSKKSRRIERRRSRSRSDGPSPHGSRLMNAAKAGLASLLPASAAAASPVSEFVVGVCTAGRRRLEMLFPFSSVETRDELLRLLLLSVIIVVVVNVALQSVQSMLQLQLPRRLGDDHFVLGGVKGRRRQFQIRIGIVV